MPGGMPQREENLPFELQVYAVMGRLKVPIGDKINHAQGGTKIVELDPTVLPRTGDWIIVAEAVAKYQRETRRDIDKHRLIVKPDISPPTVAITAPAPPDRRLTPTTPDGSEFKFDVTLAATDNVGVRRVEVQIDNVVLHHDLTPPQTGPISHTFQGVTFNRFGEGIPLVARAYDVKGQIGQEAVTVDAVDVTGPTVTISEPGAGVQVLAWNGDRGVSLAVKAGVKDVNGVSEVVAIDTADDERMMSLRRTADSGGIDSPSMWEGDTSFPGPGSYKIQITAYDDSPQRNPGYGRTIDVDVAAPIDPAGFSKTAYLRDLMDFAARRFTADNSKPLRPTILAEALYQPYDVFNRSDDAALERFAHEKVSYQRASIEILRIYIRAPESLASYCEAAYDAMLRALGSSARELRSALLLNTANAGQAERERVGDALGLETDSLGAFTLAESVEPTEFENKLKTLFGLAPTHRPAIHDVNNEVPLYQSKRIHRLRSQWRTADDEHDRPLLDPVVLKVDDLTEHGRNERAILEKRVKELSEVRKRLDRQRQSLVARYGDNAVAFEASATRLILRDLQSEPSDKVLSRLAAQWDDGDDIDARIAQVGLTIGEFLILVNLSQTVGEPVGDENWSRLLNIGTNAIRRKSFRKWRAVEREPGREVFLDPDKFGRVSPDTELRGDDGAQRRRIATTLSARRDTLAAIGEALAAARDAAEAQALPILRDYLLEKSESTTGMSSAQLSTELGISFERRTNEQISRAELAIATVSAKIAHVRSDPVHVRTWNLNVPEANFDAEWRWMGSFHNWRAATNVFAYPENYLDPSLRDDEGDFPQTQQFIDTLNRIPRLLTPPDAIKDLDTFESPNPREKALFLPLALGAALHQVGHHLAALDMYRRVFDDRTTPLERTRGTGGDSALAEIELESLSLVSPLRLFGYLEQDRGLNPHQIAALDGSLYRRHAALSVAKTLVALADAEFTRDKEDGLQNADRLYRKVLTLLDEEFAPSPIAALHFLDPANPYAIDGPFRQRVVEDNGAEWSPTGWVGGGLRIGRDKGVSLSGLDALALGKDGRDFSVTFAIQLLEGPTGLWRQVLHKGSNPNVKRTPGIWLNPDIDGIHARISRRDNWNDGLDRIYPSDAAGALQLNRWYSVAYVKAGNQLHLYIDGIEGKPTSPATLGGPSEVADGPLTFGARPEFYYEGAEAILDSVQFFDVALTPAAVRQLAQRNPFPVNPEVKRLRLRAASSLDKIARGLTIAGFERLSTDDRGVDLVATLAGGLRPSTARRMRPSNYRFDALLERARYLASLAQEAEAAYLSALQQKDITGFQEFEAGQAVGLAFKSAEVKELAVTEAEELALVKVEEKERAEFVRDQYDNWLDRGLNDYEKEMLNNYDQIRRFSNDIAEYDATMTSMGALLEAAGGNPLGWFTGEKAVAYAGAAAVSSTAFAQARLTRTLNKAKMDASRNSFRGGFERRKDEWRLQRDQSKKDIAIIDAQMFAAQTRIGIAEMEKEVADLRATQAEATLNFLNTRSLDSAFYQWMGDVLGDIYAAYLHEATSVARLAEAQLAFERQGLPTAFVAGNYWSAGGGTTGLRAIEGSEEDRLGLTGSARLRRAIEGLASHAFETRRRRQPLSQSYSLSRVDPLAFAEFRRTGRLQFRTTLEEFDRGFPGHYLRLIRRVGISVAALVSRVAGIRATLSASASSRVVVADGPFQTIDIKRPPERVSFTAPVWVSGESADPGNDVLLREFEGMGVEAGWLLELPPAANEFDFESLIDVIFTIEYTAVESEELRQIFLYRAPEKVYGERVFSMKLDFPDSFYHFSNPLTDAPEILKELLDFDGAAFPGGIRDLRIDHVTLRIFPKDGAAVDAGLELLEWRTKAGAQISAALGPPVDGIISTRRPNGRDLAERLRANPTGSSGEWRLSLRRGSHLQKAIQEGRIDDILLVFGYSGQRPPWFH